MVKILGHFIVHDSGKCVVYHERLKHGGSTSYRFFKNNPNKIEQHSFSFTPGFVDKGWVDSGMNAKQFNRMLRKQKKHYRQTTSFARQIEDIFLNIKWWLFD